MTLESDGLLPTEGQNASSARMDQMSALDIARLMNQMDSAVTAAVAEELVVIGCAIEAIVARLRNGGRLIYIGAGTSGRLGVLDAAECAPTFNTPSDMVIGIIAGGERALRQAVEEVEDDREAGPVDLRQVQVNSDDSVVGITASGNTPYVLGALRYAAENGALRIGLTCNPTTQLADCVDILIAPVVGPEALAGSTRLKAGTAQKMVLNMLSTGAMVQLGKTFGNLMVDLRASNAKLRRRSVRIVQTATGLSLERSAIILNDANGEVKTAIVSGMAGIGVEDARRCLALAGGRVRTALDLFHARNRTGE